MKGSIRYNSTTKREIACYFLLSFFILFLCSLFMYGSNDVSTWLRFCKLIESNGLLATYRLDKDFNHPPIAALIVFSLYKLSLIFDTIPFHTALKLPSILCHLLLSFLLMQKMHCSARNITFSFLLAPLLILLVAYHGNTDAICLFFSFLSILLLEKKYVFSSGLALGAAINIKLIPLILLPTCLIFLWSNKRQIVSWVLGISIVMIPFIVIFFSDAKSYFIGNCLLYKPITERWGIQFLLELTAANTLSQYYSNIGSGMILTMVTLAALFCKKEKLSLWNSASFAFLIFLVFASGFGVQYLMYLSPFLLLINSKLATRYHALAFIFLASTYYYFNISLFPLRSEHNGLLHSVPMILGFIVWIDLILILKKISSRNLNAPPQ